MAPVVVDPKRVREFESEAAFERWLSKHHDKEPELWIKMHKKGSGLASINALEAIDVVLCWGWIDAIRKGFDDKSFLQRYTPRGPKSVWSQINRDNVARLTAAGRMTPHGQKHIDKAKADGRWDAAYAPMREASIERLPDDLRAAIEKNARAKKMLLTLNRPNLFALAFRTGNMKTPAGRAKKIAELVDMLARGETIVPNSVEAKAPAKKASKKKA
jgi:uncharacterized protein YdeI (YjbR/CyaY-like superfamily)